MKQSTRIKLIVVGIAGATALVAVLAWRESGYPLAYIRPERVHLARVTGVRSKRSRDLTASELARLCELLAGARRIESFEGRRSVSVELMTVDYGRVMVHDFGNPGANLHLRAGRPDEETVTVRSGRLGRFLAKLAAELAAPAPEQKAPGSGRGES